MDIKKALTPTGIDILKYYSDKTEYHFASISCLTEKLKRSHVSVSLAANILVEAGILQRCKTGKMILYLRNPNSDFIAQFKVLMNMTEGVAAGYI